jgi:hypothetical protein
MSLVTVCYDPADCLTPLEAALLRDIAAGHQNPALTEQIERCQVVKREYSGCGFFATLAVPAGSPVVEIEGMDGTLGGGDVEAPELTWGGGSILFMKDGCLDFLEVFAYDAGDPSQLSAFRILSIGEMFERNRGSEPDGYRA